MEEDKKTLKLVQYDKNGNPKPYEIFDLELEELFHNYVNSHKDSETREKIYNGYINYIDDMKSLNIDKWQQWIDGSFTTTKKNPNDIDVLNVININILAIIGKRIKKFLTHYGNPKEEYYVDGFLLPVTNESDPRYDYCQSKYKYWKKWFGYDRERKSKGIVQIFHGENS